MSKGFTSEEEAMQLTAQQCYDKLRHPYDLHLQSKMLALVEAGNRIYKLALSNPLMKYHREMAQVQWIDPEGNKHHGMWLDEAMSSRTRHRVLFHGECHSGK